MKKAFFGLGTVIAFLILSVGGAAALQVELSEEEVCVVAPYRFKLNITNNQSYPDIFYVKALGTWRDWAWVSNSALYLEPGERKGSRISVLPPKKAEMGKYNLDVLVYSSKNRSVEKTKNLCFIVFRNYSMQVSNFSLSKGSYDPGEEVGASVTASNDGTKDFKEVKFHLKATKGGEVVGSSEKVFELETGQKKRFRASISLGRYQEPGNYKVKYTVKARGSVFSEGETTFQVNLIKEEEVERTREKGFLGSTTEIKIRNLGNAPSKKRITKKIGYPSAFLVNAPGAKTRRVGMASLFAWKVRVEPGQSKTVRYRTSYWPIYIILGVMAFLLYRAYLYIQVPTIRKGVMKTEMREDKRIFTISLEVKNRLIGEAKDVVVEDAVPSVARVIEKFDTLEPEIKKGEEETKLRWELGEVNPGEERVLHYKVKTLVEAVDYLKLPKASVRGAVNGRRFDRKSSKVKLEVKSSS